MLRDPVRDSAGRLRRQAYDLKSPAQPTVDEQLAVVTPTSQFGRALGGAGGEVDPAHRRRPRGGWSGCLTPSKIG